MKKSIFSIITSLAVFFVFSLVIFAVALGNARAQTAVSTQTTSCQTFSTNLQLGSRGVDVATLQTFLISKGFPISDLSVGSDAQKGYFGQVTFQTLKNYQKSVGIEATGFFGLITRTKINSECSVQTNNVNSFSNTLKLKDPSVTSTPKASSNIPAQDTLKLFLDNVSKKQKKEMDDYKTEYKKRINANFKQINKIDNSLLTAQAGGALQPVASIELNKFEQTKKVKFTYSDKDCYKTDAKSCGYVSQDTSQSYLKNLQDMVISAYKFDGKFLNPYSPCNIDYFSQTYNYSKSPKGYITRNECVTDDNSGQVLTLIPVPTDTQPSISLTTTKGGIQYYVDEKVGDLKVHTTNTINDDSGVVLRYNGAKSPDGLILGYTLRVSADRIFVKDYTNGSPNFYSESIPCDQIGIGFATTTDNNCIFRVLIGRREASLPYEEDYTPRARNPFYQYSLEIVDGPYDVFTGARPSIQPPPSASRDQYLAQVSSAFPNGIVYSAKSGSQVSIFGSGFGSTDNWIRIGNATVGHIISGVPSANGTSITFTLPDIDVLPIGTYSLDIAGYQTDWSDPVQFNIRATTTPPIIPSCTITTPVVTGSGPYNVKVPVSITNGPPVTTYYLYRSSSSAPSYVKVGYITTGSSGSTNITISDPSAISADTYSYTILGNKVDAPKCSPAQTVTVGVVTPIPLTSTLTLSSNLNSSYKVGDILPIKWTSKGVDKVNINLLNFKGSTIIRTIATVPASLGQYDWKVSDIDFSNDSTYIISITDASNPALKSKSGKIDFIQAPAVVPTPTPIPTPTTPVVSTPISVTILPWTAPSSAFVGQPFTYTLNWSGGPLDRSWKVFAHMVKNDNSHTFTGGDFWPNPTTDKWTGNISTASTVTIPAGTPPGTYKVMVGLYDGAPRVTTLIAGTNVLAENPTQYRYQVGTITITEPILKQGASIWDAIKGLFGKLFGF